MAKIIIQRFKNPTVLSGETFVLVDEMNTAFEVVALEDYGTPLVRRGKSTIVSATQRKVILSDDAVTITALSNQPLDVKVNDFFYVYGDLYRINETPTVKKNSESNYEYTIVGQGLMFDLIRCKLFNADATGFKTTMNFPLMGNIETFLSLIASNMQRLSTNWEVGTFTNGETKRIDFSEDNCLTALQRVCQEFKTEFWIKVEDGKFKIHTGDFGSTLPVTVQYGKGKGLYDLERRSVSTDGMINRLYVSGGAQNLPASYRNYSENLLFSDDGFIEDPESIGTFGLKEGSISFDDIYPHRTGVISSVTSLTKFRDVSMDFDLNEKESDGVTTKYLIPGTTAKIHVNTGNLAGYQFEIKSYNHTTKEFEIIPFDNNNGQAFPDAAIPAFQFAKNDEYVIIDIVMPQSYITSAEAELLAKGTEQFNIAKQAKVSYNLNIARDFIKELSRPLEIGDLINVKDIKLGIDKIIRIHEIKRDFISGGKVDDYNYQIVIADSYEIAFASKMKLEIQEVKNIINTNKLSNLRLTRAALQLTDELKESVFDTDGYFDTTNIRPNSIETGMLSVGSRSQAISTDLVLVTNDNGVPNKISSSACIIYSQSLEKQWSIPAFSFTVPDNNRRYIYAKVSKSGTAGVLHVDTGQIKYDDDPGYYFINLGILSSVIEGERIFVPTFGFTTITGGLIRTGIISDELGRFQINLNTGTITADQITFKAVDDNYYNLDEAISTLNEARDYINNVLPDQLQELHDQIDGVVDDWYLPHSPTLANLPASDWTTEALKKSHVGDRFTNTQPFVDETTTPDSGKQWRWLETSPNVFEWVLIPNSESTIALNRANEAFDLADGKRRIFTTTPFTPYEIGDMWTQGPTGDIMKCKTSRLSGTFIANDWEKAGKYTDDTRAIQAEAAAKAYADAQDELAIITSNAYADGIVSAEEARAIADATAKADAAKNYAVAQDLLLKTELQVYADNAVTGEEQARLTQATSNLNAAKSYADAQALLAEQNASVYADGLVTAEEQERLNQATANLAAAKAYSDAELLATETILKAYTDGKVSDEEARAIADTTAKANAAKAYADAQDLLLKTTLEVYADGLVTAEEQARLTQAQANLDAAKAYSDAQDALSLVTAKAYTDGEVTAEEARAILDATNKANAAKQYAEAQDALLRTEMQAYADGAVDAEEAARLLQAQQNLNAAKSYTDAEAEAAEIASKAYADGEISAAEARSMLDATNKANAAKTYAEAQDALVQANLEAYTDGKISIEEAARIQAAEQAIEASKAYSDAQAILSKIALEAYMDGAITDEEQRILDEATAKMNEAKEYAELLLNTLNIGAKNLLRGYDGNKKYWGGSGSGNAIDPDSIDPVTDFALAGVHAGVNFQYIDENNKKLQILWQ